MAENVRSAIEHYEFLLAAHYTWMSGDFEAKVAQQSELLRQLGVAPGAEVGAIDLGCGSGFQSIALARLGFDVTAVDANARLLAELDEHAKGLKIRTVKHDLSDLESCGSLPANVGYALCMGDTLSHLPSRESVVELFVRVGRMLAPGGIFVLGFRDLSREVEGLDRFIPVRADNDRVMICFLECEEEKVVVTDLIYLRMEQEWKLLKSSYRKLRLSPSWVGSQLANQGLAIRSEESVLGMSILTAQKS
jgi:SAM-dependent methyltransferase